MSSYVDKIYNSMPSRETLVGYVPTSINDIMPNDLSKETIVGYLPTAVGATATVGTYCLTPAGIPLSLWYGFTTLLTARFIKEYPVAVVAVIGLLLASPWIPLGARPLYGIGRSIHRAHSGLRYLTSLIW